MNSPGTNWQDAQLRALAARRSFLAGGGLALGAWAWNLLEAPARGADSAGPHHPAQVKRVIYLCQCGAPSQHDLFDPKPKLIQLHGQELPASIRMGQRLTTMTADQDQLPLTGSPYRFDKHGDCGMELSELLPHTAKIADRLCLIRSMRTDAINHDPAITLLLTGHPLLGRPSLGSWLSYGLGSDHANLPTFVVMVSKGSSLDDQQPVFDRLWGSGFLPSRHQGVRFRGQGNPIPYAESPPGINEQDRRRMIDTISELNDISARDIGDPEIDTRTAQYELAFRMQMAVPRLMDLSNEPATVLKSYGPDVLRPGTYAANCLLARRLAERGVRFIQLFHRGWDQHRSLEKNLPRQCRDTDQPSAALVQDLARLGLLEDTLVVWGGEFGRTAYAQRDLSSSKYGRDHHPRCFSMWLAGGGIRAGHVHGQTDELGYNIAADPVHVHDLNATLLHLLGIDHKRLTYRYQSRDFRLTDIHGELVRGILS